MTAAAQTLWDDLTGAGRHHRDAHDTEMVSASDDRTHLRARVLEAFKAAGEEGLSDYECSVRCGIARPHSAATRRAELQERGFPIVKTDQRRPTDSGKPATVWRYQP